MVHLNGRAWPEANFNSDITSSLPSALYDDLQSLNQRQDRGSLPRRSRPNVPTRGPRPLLPRSLKEALQLAELLSKSKLIPKGFETPETCLVGILYGMEVGLSPIAALQRMAVIDGRPTIWGDAALALVQASGLLQSIAEEIVERDNSDNRKILTAVCKVKREGRPEPTVGSFSIEDAKRAGLWQKPGPWTDYPKRMLTMRARAFALRDAFPDVLAGLYIREEFEGAQARCEQPRSASCSRPTSKDRTHDDQDWANEADQEQRKDIKDRNADADANCDIAKSDQVQPPQTARVIRRTPPPPPIMLEAVKAEPALDLNDRAKKQEMTRHDHDRSVSDLLSASETQVPGSEYLDPETLLDLFDCALCCALDLPTLEEIVDEFADRFRLLSSQVQERVQGIIDHHQNRVEELDQSFESEKRESALDDPRSEDMNMLPVAGDGSSPDHVGANFNDAASADVAEIDLPKGLKAVMPALGLGFLPLARRRRKTRGRSSRSLDSWNSRQRLQEFRFTNTCPSDLDALDETEVEL